MQSFISKKKKTSIAAFTGGQRSQELTASEFKRSIDPMNKQSFEGPFPNQLKLFAHQAPSSVPTSNPKTQENSHRAKKKSPEQNKNFDIPVSGRQGS